MADKAPVIAKALADLIAAETNDEMQVLLVSRRKSDVPGGLGDSRAFRAAISENLVQQLKNEEEKDA